MEDDDLVLWESNAIVRYLCARHRDAGKLYPEDLPARFDAERWMDWQQTTLNPPGRGLHPVDPHTGRAAQQRADSASVAATEPLLDLLDAHLARSALHGGRALHHGRHSHRLRNPPLVGLPTLADIEAAAQVVYRDFAATPQYRWAC
jgi:glutathione S-transferase